MLELPSLLAAMWVTATLVISQMKSMVGSSMPSYVRTTKENISKKYHLATSRTNKTKIMLVVGWR
jgi:hypothetical protein